MSATHTPHSDIYEEGLADGCDRCAQHAKDPFRSLDNEVLRQVMRRVIDGERPRSDTEEVAMYHVREALKQARWLAELDLIQFAKYMNQTDGVHLVAVVPH